MRALVLALAVLGLAAAEEGEDWAAVLGQDWNQQVEIKVENCLRRGTVASATTCLQALAEAKPAEALPVLGRTLVDQNVPEAAFETVRALQAYGTSAAEQLPALRAATRNGHGKVRAEAVKVLAGLHDTGAVAQWIGLLRDPDGRVTQAARESLRTVTGHDFGDDVSAWTTWNDQAAKSFAQQYAKLKPDLESGSVTSFRTAAQLLVASEGQDHLVAEILAPFLKHPNPDIARAAAEFINDIDGAAAKLVLATGGGVPEGIDDLAAFLREQRIEALTGPSAATTGERTPVLTGGGTSVWTLVVLILVPVGALTGVLWWLQRRQRASGDGALTPNAPKRPIGDRTRRIVSNLKRMTFTR